MLFIIHWKLNEIFKVYSKSSKASKGHEIMCRPAIMLNFISFHCPSDNWSSKHCLLEKPLRESVAPVAKDVSNKGSNLSSVHLIPDVVPHAL